MPKNEIRQCPIQGVILSTLFLSHMESLALRTAENHLADWQRGAIKTTGWENHGKSMM
jgi:hypothetical protein